MMDYSGAQPRIRAASARLERALAPIEAAFLEAGGRLTGAVEHLACVTEGFAALASRLNHPDTAGALTALEDVASHIGELGDGSQASQSRLNNLQARATALGRRIARLRKVVGEVRVLSVNAKVEAAQVSARDVDFTVFTREIGRLADLATQGLDGLGRDLAGLTDDLDQVRAGLDGFNRDHGQSLATISARLTKGLEATASRKAASAAAIADLGEVSRHMAAQIAQAVEALQVGDITRQRAEHVREALGTLVDVLSGASAGDGDALPPEHHPVLVAAICRLQGAQAANAATDLQGELDRIARTLHGLRADLGSLPGKCAAIYGDGRNHASSFLLELSHDVEGVYHVLHGYTDARSNVERVAGGIGRVVEGMVHHLDDLRSIEADMRIMGLNATLKCGRLGSQGRALSVIAQELRAYSNVTAEEARAAMAELNQLIDAARAMGGDEGSARTPDGMRRQLAEAVASLEATGEEAAHALAGLGAKGDTVAGLLEQAARILAEHPEFVATLNECSRELERLAEEAGGGEVALDTVRAEVLDLLRGRYTMASERKVHEMFEGSGAAECDSSTGIDDLFF